MIGLESICEITWWVLELILEILSFQFSLCLQFLMSHVERHYITLGRAGNSTLLLITYALTGNDRSHWQMQIKLWFRSTTTTRRITILFTDDFECTSVDIYWNKKAQLLLIRLCVIKGQLERWYFYLNETLSVNIFVWLPWKEMFSESVFCFRSHFFLQSSVCELQTIPSV